MIVYFLQNVCWLENALRQIQEHVFQNWFLTWKVWMKRSCSHGLSLSQKPRIERRRCQVWRWSRWTCHRHHFNRVSLISSKYSRRRVLGSLTSRFEFRRSRKQLEGWRVRWRKWPRRLAIRPDLQKRVDRKGKFFAICYQHVVIVVVFVGVFEFGCIVFILLGCHSCFRKKIKKSLRKDEQKESCLLVCLLNQVLKRWW